MMAVAAALALCAAGSARPGISYARSGPPAVPLDSCPTDGYWVGFNDGNTDINLFYKASGGILLSTGCHAANEPLVLPSSYPANITVPPGITAQVEDSVSIYAGGFLDVSCTEITGAPWNDCKQGQPSAQLFDDGSDIAVKGGTFEVAPGAAVSMESAGIYVGNNPDAASTFQADNATIQGPVGSPANPAGWSGIDFLNNSTGAISGTKIQGAGGGFPQSSACPSCTAAVLAEGSGSVSISSSTIANSAGNGIEAADGGSINLSQDTFTYCTTCGYPENSSNPVRFDFVPSKLASAPTTPLLSGLTSAGYGVNEVSISGGALASPALWPDSGLPYRIDGDVEITSGGSLTVLPDTTLLFQDSGISVGAGGSLTVQGTPFAPVTLTSANDRPGSAPAPAAGDWSGIAFEDGSNGAIGYARIRYGGKGGASLRSGVTATAIPIVDTTVEQSAGDDVLVSGGTGPVLERDTFGLVPKGSYAVEDIRSSGSPVLATPDYWSQVAGPGTGMVKGAIEDTPFYAQTATADSTGEPVTTSVHGTYSAKGSFGAVAAGGAGEVTVDQLSGPPGSGPAGNPSGFFDARVWNGSAFTSVTVADCLTAAGHKLLYLSPGGWEPMPDQVGPDANGCLSASLGTGTEPGLPALAGAGIIFTDGLVSTSTSLSPNSQTVTYGRQLRLKSDVSSAAGAGTGSIEFEENGTRVQTVPLADGSAALRLPHLLPGSYSFTAIYEPDSSSAFASSRSAPSVVDVRKAALRAGVKLTVPYGIGPKLSDISRSAPEISYSGFVPGDVANSALSGSLTCHTWAVAGSNPGRYSVFGCGGLGSTRYQISYPPGSVTVTTADTRLVYAGWSASGKVGTFSTKAALNRKNSGYFKASLYSASTGKPVARRELAFILGSGKSSQRCLTITNSTGAGICKVGRVSVRDGVAPLIVTFGGDGPGKSALYNAATITARIKIDG